MLWLLYTLTTDWLASHRRLMGTVKAPSTNPFCHIWSKPSTYLHKSSIEILQQTPKPWYFPNTCNSENSVRKPLCSQGEHVKSTKPPEFPPSCWNWGSQTEQWSMSLRCWNLQSFFTLPWSNRWFSVDFRLVAVFHLTITKNTLQLVIFWQRIDCL